MKNLEQLLDDFYHDQTIPVTLKEEFIKDMKNKQSELETAHEKHETLLQELGLNSNSIDYEQLHEIVNEHIIDLKTYNDLKDTAMKLLSIIADQESSNINQIAQDLNIQLNDDKL